MFTAFVAAVVIAGQVWVLRTLRSRWRARWGPRGSVALAALGPLFTGLLLAVWVDSSWRTGAFWAATTHQQWLALAAGILVAGACGATVAWWGLLRLAERCPAPCRSLLPADPARRRFLAGAAYATAAAVPFGAAAYGTLLVRRAFHLREVGFPVRSLPGGLQGLRIALLSDIHFGPYLSGPELDRVVAMANETRPHITLVTGDFITSDDDPLEACLERLARLRADAGVFGCLGNHEIYAACEDRATRRAHSLGIEILRRGSRLLEFGGARLNLAGIDYQRKRDPYLVGAERWLVPGAVNLLMSHNPDVFPVAAGMGYDLVVGGHTHGGQVTVEILEQTCNAGRFFTPFVAGLYRQGASALYVSRGIGTINLPVRLGARPEVTLLRLQQA